MTKRAHGTGSVWKHRGRFRAEVMIDGERRSLGLHDTKADALATIEAALGLIKAQAAELPTAITLRQWGDVWLARREHDGVRGIRRERSRWNRHVMAAPFADRPLKRIDSADVHTWVRSLLHVDACDTVTSPKTRRTEYRATGRKLSPQSVTHCLNLLSLSLASAKAENRVRHNVAIDVRVPRARRRRGEKRKAAPWTWLTGGEIDLVTGPNIAEPYRSIYAVLIYTGLRPNELWALQWMDVHLAAASPRLDVRESKNEKPREVPLLEPAIDALKRWRALHPGVGTAPVFPRLSGALKGQPQREDYDARWRDYYGTSKRMPGWKARAGIARHVRLYDLRHTCASHLVQGTWGKALTLYEVKEWMGHSSIIVTQRYAHLAPEGLHGKAREMRERPRRGSNAQPSA